MASRNKFTNTLTSCTLACHFSLSSQLSLLSIQSLADEDHYTTFGIIFK